MTAGGTVRAIAAEFAISKSTIDRHRRQCLAPKIAAAARLMSPSPEPRREVERAKAIVAGDVVPNVDDILSLAALLERLARSLERLESAADKSVADEQPMALAALSGQLHRGIEAAAKLTGTGDTGPETPSFGVQIVIRGDKADMLPAAAPSSRGAGVLGAVVENDGPGPLRLKLDFGHPKQAER